MKYTKYEKYKDSGITWLGEIPEHWETVKAKFILNFKTGNSISDKSSFVNPSEAYPYIATKDIDINTSEINYLNGIYIPKNNEKFRISKKKSILLCVEGANAGKKIALTDRNVCFVNKLCAIDSISNNVFIEYYYYYLKSPVFKKQFFANISGVIGGVSSSIFKNFKTPIPPLQEQTTIANFLDYKTEKINRFITKKKQLIELLNEQKAAIINQAVTKGINPNVPMKGSGIEWLGEIPEHWEVRKLKYVAKIFTGKTPKIENATTDYFENGIINWFTPGDFNNSGFLRESQRKITEKAVIENGLKLFPENSTYLISIGGTIGKVGFCSEKAFSNQQINAISFNQSIVPLFGYFYLINSKVQVDVLADFTTLPILNQAKCKQIIIAFPKDIQEQKQIVNYIENETKKIDKTISTIEKEISLVEEYKTALIAEAVTGKIDVRKWSKPLILTD